MGSIPVPCSMLDPSKSFDFEGSFVTFLTKMNSILLLVEKLPGEGQLFSFCEKL